MLISGSYFYDNLTENNSILTMANIRVCICRHYSREQKGTVDISNAAFAYSQTQRNFEIHALLTGHNLCVPYAVCIKN